MSEHQASRTLLKSPPELWAECSDAQSLARHLDDFFGEIRIIRLEPEKAVAWEGERVSGTVRLEPSGWGTKVTLTANAADAKPSRSKIDRQPAEVDPSPGELPGPLTIAAEPIVIAPVVVEPTVVASVPAPAPSSAAKPIRMGFLGRIRYLLSPPEAQRPEAAPEPIAAEPVTAEPAFVEPPSAPEPSAHADATEPVPPEPDAALAPKADVALTAALDSLGKAHHRPFSRG
jgi:hypothetical protein